MNPWKLLKSIFSDESRGSLKESSLGCSGFGSQDFSGKKCLRRPETGTLEMERGSRNSFRKRDSMKNYGYINKG